MTRPSKTRSGVAVLATVAATALVVPLTGRLGAVSFPPAAHETRCHGCHELTSVPGSDTRTTSAARRVGQELTSAHEASYLLWHGSPLAVCPGSVSQPFLTDYDAAQTGDPAQQVAELAAILATHPTLHGVQLTAEVHVQHHEGSSGPEAVHAANLQGNVLADGRFDLRVATPAAIEQVMSVAVAKLAFDGSRLTWIPEGAETANVWSTDSADFARALAMLTSSVEPLFRWVYDPFDVPLFDDFEYEVVPQPAEQTVLLRHRAGSGEAEHVDLEYVIDTGSAVAHPSSRRTFDAMGRTRETVSYGEYRTLAPDVWRPGVVRRTIYLHGEPDGPRIVVHTRVTESSILTAEEAATVPSPPRQDLLWQVWR